MLKDYFKFAWSNLVHKKVRGWLTLLGILIGVSAVVSLIGLGDGLKAAVSSQFGVSATEVITVQAGGVSANGPPGSGVINPLGDREMEAIERISNVDFVVPRVIEQGKLVFNDIAGFGAALNIPDGEQRKFTYDALEWEAEFGRLLRDGDKGKLILGYNFGADKTGFGKAVRVGDVVELQEENFEVVGILEKQGSFIFDNIVGINYDDLKSLMDNPDRVDVIVVKVKDKDLMDEAKLDIEKALRKVRDVKIGEEDFSVETPEASLSTVNDVLSGVQVFIALIASISIFVGTIGIVNTMTTSVLERKKQIGIMKAIGAKNSDIFFQFFLESGLMGLIGGLIGVIIGQTIAYVGTVGINDFLGAEISPSINFGLIALTLLGSFLIGSIAGLVPAMKAARQHPVEALRG